MSEQSTVTISGPGALVVLGAHAPSALVEQVLSALCGSDPISDVLAALTARGVRNLPEFAFILSDGEDLRVLVRGRGVRVELQGPDGRPIAAVEGAGVSTWTEAVHPGASLAAVHHGGGRSYFASSATAGVASGRLPADGSADKPLVDSEPPTTPAPVAPDGPATDPAPTAAASVESHRGEETILPSATEFDVAAAKDSSPEDEPVDPVPNPDFDLANLFETRYRGVEAAAVRPAQPTEGAASPEDQLISELPGFTGTAAPTAAPSAPSVRGDHDGLTISAAELALLQGTIAQKRNVGHGPTGASMLQAVICPAGHSNSPRAELCRACAQPIIDRTIVAVTRPVLGQLVFDTGMVVDVDRPVLLGRKPTVDIGSAGIELPALITLPDPDASLSRIHAEIRLDEWEVLVLDRGSTNGTFVELPGRPKMMLRRDEPSVIVVGTTISFADVTSCMFTAGAR